MPTTEQLEELQSKSLEEKVQISSARIIEWYTRWDGQVYVSFSGGKDSTVLLHLVRRLYPDVVAVFSDTGLEYPEIREFVKSIENVDWVVPQKYNEEKKEWVRYTFKDVIKDVGYPIISKEIADVINGARHNVPNKICALKGENLNGVKSQYRKKYIKYNYLMDSDFNISDKCCTYMKKQPIKQYEKLTNKKGILGTMTYESMMRRNAWMKTGCNAFNSVRPLSMPLAFWTEQDILHYIKKYNLRYASIYGELIEDENEELHFTKEKRTGCVFCGFGCHLEKEPNRFQRLAETHPELYNYCINGGEYNEEGIWQPSKEGLGMGKVLDYIGVNYKPIEK